LAEFKTWTPTNSWEEYKAYLERGPSHPSATPKPTETLPHPAETKATETKHHEAKHPESKPAEAKSEKSKKGEKGKHAEKTKEKEEPTVHIPPHAHPHAHHEAHVGSPQSPQGSLGSPREGFVDPLEKVFFLSFLLEHFVALQQPETNKQTTSAPTMIQTT